MTPQGREGRTYGGMGNQPLGVRTSASAATRASRVQLKSAGRLLREGWRQTFLPLGWFCFVRVCAWGEM